ncbi:MAG: glycosyltransferase family 39 protein [Candidatus Omnitrophica bacterium]|nr:glycosyltransferase family 39 protein [Candidatus Omnitrophota bacterium]
MNSLLYKNRLKIIQISVLIIITVILRLPSFFLSHNNNDELIHLSLAKKIDDYGINVFKKQQYNLFYIERGIEPKQQLIGVLEGERKIGSLLEGFLGERKQLSHHPPALPFVLSISHKLFARSRQYVVNISSNTYSMIKNSSFQFYSCIVPFVFSCLFILAVYFLGSLFFSHKIGLFSALFLSLTPIELITANKIWADDMTAFFVVLAVSFYLYSLKKNKPIFSLLSGLSCGVSILTKMSGIYIIFVVLLFHLFENRNKRVNFKNIKDFLFDRKILYFLAGVFIASAWWISLYYSYFSVYSTRTYFIINETWEAVKTWNRYFAVASLRPWYSYFILVPFQFPLYLLSFIFIPLFILRNKIKDIETFIGKEYRYLQFLILWTSVVFVFLTLKPGKELRYMLIAYPAISILSAYCFNLFYDWVKAKKFRISLGLQKMFFVSIILLSLVFSLKIALPRILFRADIIPIPF